ncbi:MAG: PspA-associated protein PspAA [Solirubrobacterales bacterium]
MIVRLMGQGQYRLDDAAQSKLDQLDDNAVAALEAEDVETLDGNIQAMWELVQADGTPLDADELVASDVIIPPADLTIEETRALFSDQGLVPDLPS